jgi:protein MPE1
LNSASWNAHLATTKNLSANDIQNLAPTDPDLTCPICSKLLRDAVLTPCCSISFCQECVHNFLNENDFLCPECESRIKNLDKLKVDEGRRGRVKVYIDEMVEASKEVVVVEEVSEPVEAKVEDGVAVVKVEDGVKGEDGAALDSKTVLKVDDTVITTEVRLTRDLNLFNRPTFD